MKSHRCKYIFLLVLFLLTSYQVMAQEFDFEDVSVEIMTKQSEDLLEIAPVVLNSTNIDLSLSYQFQVKRNSASGSTSNNKQSGEFLIKSGEQQQVSTVNINAGTNDEVLISVGVYLDSTLIVKKVKEIVNKKNIVTKKRKKHGEAEEKKSKQQVFSDGVVLRGLVIDETKTKFGKDYYDFLFSYYNLYFSNSPARVVVSESLLFGRSTKIEVFIDQNLIFQFLSQPRSEFLENMAKETLGRINRYYQKNNINFDS